MRPRPLAPALLCCLLAGTARAQLTAHAELGPAFFITRPRSTAYGPGAGLALRADHPVWRFVSAESSAALLVFSPAEGTPQPGTILALGAGLRLRPLELFSSLSPGARSAWAAGMVHGVGAGPLFRLGYEIGAGVDVLRVGNVTLGPCVRFVHVFQPDGPGTDSRDALALWGGVSLSLRVPASGPGSLGEAEVDSDGDGLPDARDRCPLGREVLNGLEDADGCPDQAEAAPVVERARIQIKAPVRLEPVRFAFGSAEIDRDSYPTLATAAKVIFLHPEIRRIRLDGHTDARERPELALRRAEAVRRHLIEVNGVEAELLQAVGRGAEVPESPGDTAEGRARNRRVELVIADRAD
jgi:outer membrane protein OmpA-like peptidoglycan-associated protein